VEVNASDDFGLRGVDLHYSVNGGAEKTVSLLDQGRQNRQWVHRDRTRKDFKVEPGDIVSLYASARDARPTTNTDMFFIEAQPFREKLHAGAGDRWRVFPVSRATQSPASPSGRKRNHHRYLNQIKGNGAKASDAENAAFLAATESKLRDQANSMAERMKARQMEESGESFRASSPTWSRPPRHGFPPPASCGSRSGRTPGAGTEGAAVSAARGIRFPRHPSGLRPIRRRRWCGISGATRDMQGIFDLELDTEKTSTKACGRVNRPMRASASDGGLQKLEQLAKRQQELAEQQTPRHANPATALGAGTAAPRSRTAPAADAAARAERAFEPRRSTGQQGTIGAGQVRPARRIHPASRRNKGAQSGQVAQGQANQRLRNRRCHNSCARPSTVYSKALQDMRQAASRSRLAPRRVRAEARPRRRPPARSQQSMAGLRDAQSSGQVSAMGRQADDLARRQQEFEGQMRRAFGPQGAGLDAAKPNRWRSRRKVTRDLKRLEQQMQNARAT